MNTKWSKIFCLILFVCSSYFQMELACKEPNYLEFSDLKLKPLSLKDIRRKYIDAHAMKTEDDQCPTKKQEFACPTYNVIDIDVNRIPVAMPQKRCRCHSCLSQEGDVCMPLYTRQNVLRRVGCHNNTYIYKPALEPVVVGCQCKTLCRGSECLMFSDNAKMPQ